MRETWNKLFASTSMFELSVNSVNFIGFGQLWAFKGDLLHLDKSDAGACLHVWMQTWEQLVMRKSTCKHSPSTNTCTFTVTKVNKWQSDGNYGPWWNNQHNGGAAPMFSLIKANSHQTITHRVSAGARVSIGGEHLNGFTVTDKVLGITAAAPTNQQHIHIYVYICSKSVQISF